MRIVIVAPHFPEYALLYARAIARHADVLVIVDAGQFRAEFAERATPHAPSMKVAFNDFRTPFDLMTLARLTRAHKPSHVHFQEAAGPRRGLFSVVLLHLTRASTTTVLTVHDPVPHAGRDAKAARRTAWFRDHLRRYADIVVVHGPSCLTQYQKRHRSSTQSVFTSRHGVLLEPTVHAPPVQTGVLRLLMFGRMERYKGLDILLEAAELLRGRGVDFSLTVAGKGPELDRLEERLQAIPHVVVANRYVPPLALIKMIQDSECVVLPYHGATQSGVLAAAYAGHRYVIASDTGGLRDIVRHGVNGMLVPPGNAEALADAIELVAHSRKVRAQLLAGACLTAVDALSWDGIAEDFVTFLTNHQRQSA